MINNITGPSYARPLSNSPRRVRDGVRSDSNAITIEGNSLLHYACEKGSLQIVQFLVRNNSLINIKNNDGETPLQLAEKNGHQEVVNFLIQKGAK